LTFMERKYPYMFGKRRGVLKRRRVEGSVNGCTPERKKRKLNAGGGDDTLIHIF